MSIKKATKIFSIMSFITLLAITVLYLAGTWSIQPQQTNEVNYQSATFERELASLKTTTEPEYNILYTFPLSHTDGSTTTLNLVEVVGTSTLGGWYNQKTDKIYLRILNYEEFIDIRGKEYKIPIIYISIIGHELHHMSTYYNYKTCSNTITNVCLEKSAYDFEYLYKQIRSYEEDWLLMINKN